MGNIENDSIKVVGKSWEKLPKNCVGELWEKSREIRWEKPWETVWENCGEKPLEICGKSSGKFVKPWEMQGKDHGKSREKLKNLY